MFKLIFSSLVLALVFTGANSAALAQKETASGVEVEKDLELLRRDLRSEKKKLIALNLSLTEAEATKFWPVYDRYIADITKPYDQFYEVVKEFAAIQKTATDAQSSELMKRYGQLLVQIAQTRQKYIPIFEQTIPAKKAAWFIQVDRRLYSLLELQVISEMPLLIQ
jgi:hypothetical protein